MPPDPSDLPTVLRRCLGYAFALSHDRMEAEDLVQDACLSTLRAGAGLDVPYLFRAIRSRFIDRRRRTTLLVVESLDDGRTEGVGEVGGALDGEALLVTRQELANALGDLRPIEREALWLAEVEGWSAAEIGEMLGVARGTVLSLTCRARERLRGQVGEGRTRSMS